MGDGTVNHSQWVATGPDKQMQDTGNARTTVFTLDVNGKLGDYKASEMLSMAILLGIVPRCQANPSMDKS